MVLPKNLPEQVALISSIRVDAALPAAGAWNEDAIFAVAGISNTLLYIEYIRGGAGGAVDIRIEFSPYATNAVVPAGYEEWFQDVVFAAGAMAAGTEIQSREQRTYVTYQAVGAARENFVLPIEELGNAERIRVSVRESGNLGAPGNCQIVQHSSEIL